MTSIGTGYDLSNSVFSPDGRNFQVEYAVKAVENGTTSVGIRCNDGVVFAVEKLVLSKLLVPKRNVKIQTIDRHVGCVYSGLIPDGRHLVNRGREEAQSHKKTYSEPIPLPTLADRLGYYVQAHTLYNSVRPFGVTAIFGGVDEKGPHLYMLEPSGTYWGYKGTATGKGRQTAKAELEKIIDQHPEGISARHAIKEAAKVIYMAHEDNKEKDFELEISWCSLKETNGLHKFVEGDLLDEAIEYAKKEVNGDQDSDSDASSDEESGNNNNSRPVADVDAEGDVQIE
ncbi:PRE10 (YOR362C) [Zygosaccharomyces parabailii]|uniref:ZYBA0S07-05666g1_1 n=1 Tax=Zygosaccharomyces bailii (strain CLIB 213 / ATCC 58445 / CBS 680 / BCRC 21525 / NBRC 1098 / NCYC 1416 / NRRL Y-2227) TaxID=1333698 RepID=A0A8J2XCA7_ZYGB2|nr:PRE10 (YOR362C) [Zygosaccharomyces parabailii]CDF90637.1 ZYBA0S07-05666g1_1 [Zygosaccharomyces bailii CLIB 213]CDH14994.1 probable Proteasome component C1 [Zygosaccharomyces bailii ISA1307]SJM84303.1 probable Probable proteasome subunit alpha type-7 [Zygosaccharomyces bailii]